MKPSEVFGVTAGILLVGLVVGTVVYHAIYEWQHDRRGSALFGLTALLGLVLTLIGAILSAGGH